MLPPTPGSSGPCFPIIASHNIPIPPKKPKGPRILHTQNPTTNFFEA